MDRRGQIDGNRGETLEGGSVGERWKKKPGSLSRFKNRVGVVEKLASPFKLE